MRKNATDWTGYQYSFLRIVGPGKSRDPHGRIRWLAECACGRQWEIDIRDLRKAEKQGRPKSCGCQTRALISKANTTHGMSHHPAYAVWQSMIRRCTSPTHPAWANYGGRGITVCDRWLHSFENFWADIGPTYDPSIPQDLDRRKNNEGYSPENCRWVTRKVNCRNRRKTRFVCFGGETMTVSELAERSGVRYTTLLYRLDHGCPSDRLLDAPDTTRRFTTL